MFYAPYPFPFLSLKSIKKKKSVGQQNSLPTAISAELPIICIKFGSNNTENMHFRHPQDKGKD